GDGDHGPLVGGVVLGEGDGPDPGDQGQGGEGGEQAATRHLGAPHERTGWRKAERKPFTSAAAPAAGRTVAPGQRGLSPSNWNAVGVDCLTCYVAAKKGSGRHRQPPVLGTMVCIEMHRGLPSSTRPSESTARGIARRSAGSQVSSPWA